MSEGIGDTIRVSLSENPEEEIPVARKLAEYFPRGISDSKPAATAVFKSPSVKPEILKKINGPLVLANMTSYPEINADAYGDAGFKVNKETLEIRRTDSSADLIMASAFPKIVPADVSLVLPYKKWIGYRDELRTFPLFSPET